ncbi:unnamed protein product [Cochlearia groenlandica]
MCGATCDFSPVVINEELHAPTLTKDERRSMYKKVARISDKGLVEYMTEKESSTLKGLKASSFKEEKGLLYRIICSNWSLVKNLDNVTGNQLKLVYQVKGSPLIWVSLSTTTCWTWLNVAILSYYSTCPSH